MNGLKFAPRLPRSVNIPDQLKRYADGTSALRYLAPLIRLESHPTNHPPKKRIYKSARSGVYKVK
jgi:hypothetical protein